MSTGDLAPAPVIDAQKDGDLRQEIVESQRSQADFLKWKLVSVAAVASVAFGFGQGNAVPDAARFLLCLVPLICAYVDLISLHLMIRILTIGQYLALSGSHYERFAFQIRPASSTNPFVFEAVALHGSSLVFNIVVLTIGFVLLGTPGWSHQLTAAYIVAGVLGIVATVFSWVLYNAKATAISGEAVRIFQESARPR